VCDPHEAYCRVFRSGAWLSSFSPTRADNGSSWRKGLGNRVALIVRCCEGQRGGLDRIGPGYRRLLR
jgi:hypothetical protein